MCKYITVDQKMFRRSQRVLIQTRNPILVISSYHSLSCVTSSRSILHREPAPRVPQHFSEDEDHRQGLISIFVWVKQPLLSDMYVREVQCHQSPNLALSSNQFVLVPGVGKYEYGMHFMYAQIVCLDTSYIAACVSSI